MNAVANEVQPTQETALKLGLLPEEFGRIIEILGRTPNFTELSIFSVMWSEHCSYKNSIHWLKTLPRTGVRLLAETGKENAGLVDIGAGLAAAFKIESHNHPSAIEPYQGAATGVGGIHRDIFTMGARPVAALNSLRFGDLSKERTRYLLRGVVKGIGDYGNSFGVPTVGGETWFDPCYQVNPLVNAMSVGIVEAGKTVSAIAYGAGNPVFIVGSATGKDGIHGATFASEDISGESEAKLPSVQVGDPFQEKKLLEATLEAIATGSIIGMQDMGAAGITCSTSEMSEKGGHGMRIHLDKVPTRQANMQPFEILLSESQERMLVVAKKGQEDKMRKVFSKWDLNCSLIGEVTEGGMLEYYMNGILAAKIPAAELVLGGGAPVYQREYQEPEYLKKVSTFDLSKIPVPSNLTETARLLAASPNLASKKWIYRQYDSMVGINNISTNAPSDAAVVRIKNTSMALALTTDCNSRYVHADPCRGTAIAVSEAARNIVCAGGEPVAITNCLNFGNPYNKEVYWQFVNTIKGMGDACRKFDTPVTGGNVSFYNQSSDEGPVNPTPVIGMLGIIKDVKNRMTLDFKETGNIICLIGETREDLGSSEYVSHVHQVKLSPAPWFDLEIEFRMQQVVKNAIEKGMILSAHDVAEGGIFFTLLESAMPRSLGFSITIPQGIRPDAWLFGESQSRVIVSMTPEKEPLLSAIASKAGIPVSRIGEVTDGSLEVNGTSWGAISGWEKIHGEAIGKVMDG